MEASLRGWLNELKDVNNRGPGPARAPPVGVGEAVLPDSPERLVAGEAGIGLSIAWTLRLVVRAR